MAFTLFRVKGDGEDAHVIKGIKLSLICLTIGIGILPDTKFAPPCIIGRQQMVAIGIKYLVQGIHVGLRFRRMIGLYCYFYCCCHFLIWFIADHSLDVAAMAEDIVKRPYITLGFSAFILLLPLALTSNQALQRRLGRKWKTLHQLVYLILALGVAHFLWLVKVDYLEPTIYAIIAVVLLLHRVTPIKRLMFRSSTVARSADG